MYTSVLTFKSNILGRSVLTSPTVACLYLLSVRNFVSYAACLQSIELQLVCSYLGYVYLKQLIVGGPLGESVCLPVFSRGFRDRRGKAEYTCSAAVSNSAEGILCV